MLRLKKKSGQSTVEYILLFTAVVGVMIAFLINDSGGFKGKINETLKSGTDGMADMANRLKGSRNAS